MSTQQNGSYLKSLTAIFMSITIGTLSLLVISLFLLNPLVYTRSAEFSVLFYAAVLYSIVASGMVVFLSANPKLLIKNASDKGKKMSLWRTYFIIRIAILEGSVWVNVIGFWLTHYIAFPVIGAVLCAVMISIRPSQRRIVADLGLSAEDMENS